MPLSRRAFVKTAGALAAAAALPAGARPPRPIRKAVKLGMVQEGSTLREKLLLLADLGFDGLEVESPAGHDPQELLAARDESGLLIHGVVDAEHWRSPLSDPSPEVRARGRAALEQALRDCRTCGGSTVLLVPAVVSRRVSYAAAYARSQQEIRRVLPLAEELDVAIAVENVWNSFLLSPLEAARYVDELGPRVGWYLDVGNVVNYGWPQHWVRTLGQRILKLDVKEFSRRKRDDEGLYKGFQVELGEGDCDWPEVMAALDEVGYGGWATAEVPGGDRARLAQIAARMDRVLQA